jgi:hypothetical protein
MISRREQATARYLYLHQRVFRVFLRYKESLELRPCRLPWVPLSGKVETLEFEVPMHGYHYQPHLARTPKN